jgi:hypothetical protein
VLVVALAVLTLEDRVDPPGGLRADFTIDVKPLVGLEVLDRPDDATTEAAGRALEIGAAVRLVDEGQAPRVVLDPS